LVGAAYTVRAHTVELRVNDERAAGAKAKLRLRSKGLGGSRGRLHVRQKVQTLHATSKQQLVRGAGGWPGMQMSRQKARQKGCYIKYQDVVLFFMQ
jgi:hypothetical protein